MTRRAFTAWDAVVLAVLLALNGLLWSRGGSEGPAALEVVSAAGLRTEPLAGPRELPVTGPLGTTWVRVEADSARVTESPCPERRCIAAGPISRPGQVVACLPNRVALRLVAAGGGGVDAVAR